MRGSSSTKSSSSMLASAYPITSILQENKPYLLYGTAWKKDQTSHLVSQAIHTGFRFIDTACQPKHYNEPGVGEGWTQAAKELNLKREDFFLQTKFTSVGGQDPNDIPYDEHAPIEEQVRQSLDASLRNLKTSYLDSLVMHSPYRRMEDTLVAYRTMETFVDGGMVHMLGISNCYDFHTFRTIYESARIKPKVLQNRFYSDSGFDVQLRDFCRENGVTYQSFWTLTGNRHALASGRVHDFVERMKGRGGGLDNLTSQTLMYAFMMTLGHTPLSGTTSLGHMAEDVAIMEKMQGGEQILDEDEMDEMTKILGIDKYFEN